MSKKSGYQRHPWVFTRKRQESIKRARQEHERLVKLGRRARARGER